MSDNNKFLRYGDRIILISNDIAKYYMAARSIFEENVYFIECPYAKLSQNSTFYPLQSELIFSIYPKLNYEAFKEFNRMKPQEGKGKVDLLKKRLDVEIDNNDKRIKNFLGQPITFGSEIQLYHAASKSFIRATREKNSNLQFSFLYNLKLSRNGGSGVYFKITPYYSFMREGEKMALSDKFYLENTKLHAWIEYKQLPLISNPQNSQRSNAVKLEYPPIFELSTSFKAYEAGLKVHDTNSSLIANVVLPVSSNINPKIILWGDYVRIKHMRKANKQTGFLFSDPTLIGLSHSVLFRTVNGPFQYERDSFQAIFQIVPPNESDYGTAIKFEGQLINMRLRHLLTGRYLQIGGLGKTCTLSLTLDEYTKGVSMNLSVNEISMKPSDSPRLRGKFKGSATPIANSSLDPHDQGIKKTSEDVLNQKRSQNEATFEKLDMEADFTPFQKFYRQTKVILQNTVSSEQEETYLSTSSCFIIRNSDDLNTFYLSIKIQRDDNEEYWQIQPFKGDKQGLSQHYKPRFHDINPIKKIDKFTEIADNTDDFFFFSPVTYDEIAEIHTASSMIFPIINLADGKLFIGDDIIQDKMDKARKVIERLNNWLIDNESPRELNPMKKVTKQKLLREIGVIDLLITVLYRFFSEGLLSSNHSSLMKYKATIKDCINFLQNILYKNKPNSIYSFQWDMFFMQMLLAEQLPRDLGLDHLLTTIFSENQMSVDYLSKIGESLKNYHVYDLKALNIAIALCESIKDRPKKDQEFINLILLENTNNLDLIFLKLFKNDKNQIFIKNSENDQFLIESSLEYKNKKLFDYITGLIKLATELSKGQPQITIKALEKFYPLDVSIALLKSSGTSFVLKSAILDLIVQMHFGNVSRAIKTIEFPNNIKLLSGVKLSENIEQLSKARESDLNENFASDTFNFKQFLSNFLEDVHIWNRDEHKLNKSVFRSIMILLQKNMYSYDEILCLKEQLYNYLKHALAVIHGDVATEPEDDNNNQLNEIEGDILDLLQDDEDEFDDQIDEASEMIKWMLEILNILIFLQKYEIDMTIQFMIDEEKYSKYFNYKWLAKQETFNTQMSQYSISRIKKDKQTLILRYMHDNFEIQNYKHIQCLVELLLIGNLQLTCSVVNLLYETFSQFKNFLIYLNNVEIITNDNIDIYTQFLQMYDELNQELLKIESDKIYELTDNYKVIDQTLSQMNSLFYQGRNFHEIDGISTDIRYYRIYENNYIDSSTCKEKQSLLRNMDFLNLIKILFNGLMNGYIINRYDLEIFLRNFLMFFLFFVYNDAENQTLFSKESEIIKQLFKIQIPSLEPLILKIIAEIYKDNYPLLITLHKGQHDIVHLVVNKIIDNFKILIEDMVNNKETDHSILEYMIHGFRILIIFFQIQNNFLIQNQLTVSSTFKTQIISNYIKITEILYDKVKYAVNEYKIDQLCKENRDFKIQVPIEISFAIYFFKTFGIMAKGPTCSNSAVSLNNKHFLNLTQIQELLKISEDWYNLKLALIIYLNHTYIRNKKLEDNETIELHNIIKETLKKEIYEYMRFLKNRHLYMRSPKAEFEDNIMNIFPISHEIILENNVDNCYHQFILYGVLDSYNFYIERMKQRPSDRDIIIMDDYLSILKDLNESLISFSQNKKNNQQIDKKNKLIEHLEPSLPIFEDEEGLDEHPKDAFKRLNPTILKNEISKYHTKVINTPEIRNMSFANKENKSNGNNKKITGHALKRQLNIDEEIIQAEHNSELEMLIKFLVHTKIDNVQRFKGIVTGFMSILSSDESSQESRNNTLIILRRLSSFKEDEALFESIQIDLIELNFVSFLCKIIIETHDEDIRIEFIIGMLDFLDEASRRIQEDFYDCLNKDEENDFLITIKNFILVNFEDFREYEKNYNEQSEDVRSLSKPVVYKKMKCVIFSLELIRLACEGHFSEMQNYLRVQIQNGIKIKNSINFISFIADLFNRYTKSINENNAMLGIKIIDTLIEMLYGPCQENQLAVCQTKILENLEDLIVEISNLRGSKFGPIQNNIHPVNKTHESSVTLSGIKKKMSGAAVNIGESPNGKLTMIQNYEKKMSKKVKSAEIEEKKISEEIVSKAPENQTWSCLNDKIIEFIQAMLEGSYEANIIAKISHHVNVTILLDRMQDIYKMYYKRSKKQPFTPVDPIGNKLAKVSIINLSLDISKSNLESLHGSSAYINYEAFLKEGVYLKIILNLLGDLSPDVKRRLYEYEESKIHDGTPIEILNYQNAQKYFGNHIANIEIVNQKGNLQRIYFPLPKKTKYLSLVTKQKFKDTVKRDSINEKLFCLLKHESAFNDEMEYFINLRAKKIRFSLTFFSLIRNVNLVLSAVLNGFILFDKSVSGHENLLSVNPNDRSSGDSMVWGLGIAQIAISWLILLLWFIFIAPLDFKTAIRAITSKDKDKDEDDDEVSQSALFKIKDNIVFIYRLIKHMALKTYFAYLAIYSTFAILGLLVSKVFFALLLLDVIDSSPVLKNVINAITLNHKQLIMTGVLGVLLIYIWGVIGFFEMSDVFQSINEPDQQLCESIWHCFLTVMEQGLRAGGGIGDVIVVPSFNAEDYAYERRFFYDLLFFIFIIVILLNIIFGIIIDTFAELRDKKRFRDFDEKNRCFICDLDRFLFEKEGKSFESHLRYEHNPWNYLYYIIYLKTKDHMEYNGTETYVYQKYKNEDLSWFPIQRALSLSIKAEETRDDIVSIIEQKLNAFESKIMAQNTMHIRFHNS